MKDLPDILVFEESEKDFERFRHRLDQDGVPHRPLWVRSRESFLNRLHDCAPSVILADVSVADSDLRSTLRVARDSHPDVPLILLAGKDEESLALRGLEQGAADYLLKPELKRLGSAVRRAYDQAFQCEQRRHMARELAYHQDVYKSLVGNIPYQIFRKDADGCFTFVNDRFARLIGRPVAEIIGRRDADFFPEDLAAKYRDDDVRVMRTGRMLETIETNRAGDQTRVVKVVKVPVHDVDGRVVGVQGMFWDITNEQRMEEQLARQILTMDRVQDAIIECTGDAVITYWNRAAEKLYQHPGEDALGRDLIGMLGIDPEAFQAVRRHLLDHGDWRGELVQSTRDGTEIIVESQCTAIRASSGDVETLHLVNRDITDRKRLERQLMALNTTQNMNLLSHSIAHDLQNVLSPVQMAADHLQRLEVAPADESSFADAVKVIRGCVETGSALLRKLAPSAVTEREEIDLTRLLSEFSDHLRQTFPPTVLIEQEIENSLRSVVGDATHIRQVLMNLAINARHAMNDDGLLRLSARNASVGPDFFADEQPGRPGDYVMVCVTDTGEGMDEATQSRIFQPYFTTKPKGEGTGLGLATVSRLVYAEGGFIRVASRRGQGTRFQIYLPVSEAQPREAVARPETAGAGRRTVLLVDDDPIIRTISKTMLEHHSYAAMMAGDGKEGLEAMERHDGQIDLVVTDMRMPRLDGLDLIRELRRRHCDVPIVVMTGVDVRNDFNELSQFLGVKHFLAKPFSQHEFIEQVREALALTESSA